MGIRYWVRVVMMSLSFLAVIFIIRRTQEKGLPPAIVAPIVGEESRVAKIAPTHQRVDLCENRVRSLKTSNGLEVFENGLNWFSRKNSAEKKLDPVSVERWFGKNCSVFVEDLRPAASKDVEAATPVLILDFIQGAPAEVKRISTGEFIWKQISFHSKQFEEALVQLAELQEASPNGRARAATHRQR